MDKALKEKIEAAIDRAMLDFRENEDSIFFNKKDQLKYQFSVEKEMRNWKKNQKCIVKGCNNKSIERSHTIQKSNSLKLISENGHVLMPKMLNLEEVGIMQIGINEASTFPGYCKDHERLFEGFENIKDFISNEHLGLQIYRTICREIVLNENNLKNIGLIKTRYLEFRSKKIGESVLANLGTEALDPNLKFVDFKFKGLDYRLKMAKDREKTTSEYLNNFLYKIHDGILNDLKKQKFQKTAFVAIRVDQIIPVAVAGRGNFHIKLKGKIKNVEIIFNVLPTANGTYIFVSALRKFKEEIEVYMSQCKHPLLVINLVENWMIHGSDHWFIKPSVWYCINKEAQSKILNEILNYDFNIGKEISLTIFNEIKLDIIRIMELNYSKLSPDAINLLRIEKNKITLAPDKEY